MSTRITHQADGTARGQTQQNTANSIIDLRKQPARTPKQAEPTRRTPISYAVFCLKKKQLHETETYRAYPFGL